MTNADIPHQQREFSLEAYIAETTAYIGTSVLEELDMPHPSPSHRVLAVNAKARDFGREAYARGYTYSYYVAPDGLLYGYLGGQLNADVEQQLLTMTTETLLKLLYRIR